MAIFKNMLLINPDIHGRTFWKDSKDLPVDKIIFLGDYLDPYTKYELIIKKEALENFKEIIDFKKANKDKVILLIGNHDCEYLDTSICDCRCDYNNYNEIQDLIIENNELFDLFYKYENKNKSFLFSHAGIVDGWIDRYFKGENQLNILEKLFLKNRDNFRNLDDSFLLSMGAVSSFRGGDSDYGSIVWRDVRESISERFGYQIFGHTMLAKPYVTKNYACLDVKRSFILNDENKFCEIDGTELKIY